MDEAKITALIPSRDNLIADYSELNVHDNDSLTMAGEALNNIRVYLRKIEAIRVGMVKPFNDGVKAINARVHALTEPIKQLDAQITQKIKDYRAFLEAQRAEEQKRLNALAEANLTEDSLIPEAIAPIVPEQAKSVAVTNGKITFVKIRKWELEDIEKVPREYFVLDSAKITAVTKAGGNIPGIRAWYEEVLQSRR